MTKFKCKNCGNSFNKFCDSELDSYNVMCPNCGSHWVEIDDSIINWTPKPIQYITCGNARTNPKKIIFTWGEKPKFKW